MVTNLAFKGSQMSRPGRHALSPILGVAALIITAREAYAQGPVYLGSKIPVALWSAGAVLLGIVMAYGIMRNKKRTRAEKTTHGRRNARELRWGGAGPPAKDIE